VSTKAHHPGFPGTLVAPTVVGDNVQLRQAAQDPPEALGPVERSVHEDGGRRPRGGPRPFENVESGRIAHEEGDDTALPQLDERPR
jgi:hypothetical protein